MPPTSPNFAEDDDPSLLDPANVTASHKDEDLPTPGSHDHRYALIARDLTRAIADGRYVIGQQLPTEVELCERYGVSRFTARSAVQVLIAAGLVNRRKRAGSVVIALPGDVSYSQQVTSVKDLLQYARDTELVLLYVGKINLGPEQAAECRASQGANWVFAIGVRFDSPDRRSTKPGRAICVTRLYLNPILEGVEDRIRNRRTAVYAMIEADYNVSISRVEQDLHGAVLASDDASNLDAPIGAPALRIVRRYFDSEDRLLLVAESVHPSDRFVYHMRISR